MLDDATGKWGIRVSRVELKAIDPPASIQDSMEKQMRAERDRRAVILTAEGTSSPRSSTRRACGRPPSSGRRVKRRRPCSERKAKAKAITTVFGAIHAGNPDNLLLAYQYLQTLPKLAEGPANKLWIIPSELTEALKGIGTAFGSAGAARPGAEGVRSAEGPGTDADASPAPSQCRPRRQPRP